MVQGVPYKKSDILTALRAKKGIIGHAAEMLGCERNTIYDWMERDEEIAKCVEEERAKAEKNKRHLEEEIKEDILKSYQELVREKETACVIFGMKTKHKWRENDGEGDRKPATVNAPTMDPK